LRLITNEQSNIIFSEDSTMHIFSLAGTGKTFTLSEYAKLHKFSKILYIVYNSSMRISAMMRFSERVKVETFHSLSYKYIGKHYEVGDIKLEKISEITKLNIRDSYSLIKLIGEFCNSDKKEITEFNSPLVEKAKLIWDMMLDKKLPMLHDVHLKLFELNGVKLSDYEIIMVDEAQDINIVGLNIVNNQDAKKIFIGDPNQRIYSFRGSLDIFKDKSDKYMLTKSFRFGQEIADIANIILERKNYKYKLEGDESKRSFVSTSDFEDIPVTIIFRTNTALFNEAIKLINSVGDDIYIVGAENIFNKILNVLNLKEGKEIINDKHLESMNSYREFIGLSNLIPEYKFIIKLIDSYGPSLRAYIKKLQKASKKNASHTLVTAHKSKGLEFFYVKIYDDFTKIEKANEEELNILYVAITRSTDYLTLNKDISNYINIT